MSCKRTALVLMCAGICSCLPAQTFQNLSTTDDGSVLYFSSSIREKGSDQTLHSKIFRWDTSAGVKLVAEMRDEGSSDCGQSNYYDLVAPQVSGDSKTLAYTGTRTALFSRLCSPYETNQGLVEQNGRETKLDGNIAITHGGRYAVTTSMAAIASGFHIVTDLTSNAQSVIAGAFNGSQRRLTDQGAILSPEPSALILTGRDGITRVLQTQLQVNDAIIDPTGAVAVYLTQLTGPGVSPGISAVNVATGREARLVSAFAPGNLSLTNDGLTLLFSNIGDSGSVRQAYIVGTTGNGAPRQVTSEKDGITAAAISGNGRVLFAVAGDSRLLRIDVTTGAVTEIVPATPFVTAAYRIASPPTSVAASGSVMALYGSGLTALQHISVCGRNLPFLGTPPRFIVPFDMPEGTCEIVVQSSSPFEHGIKLNVQTYDPRILALVHQDFASLITPGNPAHPGETIAAYMDGLGPLDGNGALMAGFHCTIGFMAVQVPYAGPAPAIPGIYQINIRVPNLTSSSPMLTCEWDSLTQASTTLPLGPVLQ